MTTGSDRNQQAPGGSQEDEMAFMDTNEAAVVLGFGPRTVRSMCARGEIPAMLIGGEYRINRRELKEWLERSRVKPKGEQSEPAAAS